MLEKLQEQTSILARTERKKHGDMARQIAHEINNPLTPLNFLFRIFRENTIQKTKIMKKKVRNLTQVVVNQIDIISSITKKKLFCQNACNNDSLIDVVKR